MKLKTARTWRSAIPLVVGACFALTLIFDPDGDWWRIPAFILIVWFGADMVDALRKLRRIRRERESR